MLRGKCVISLRPPHIRGPNTQIFGCDHLPCLPLSQHPTTFPVTPKPWCDTPQGDAPPRQCASQKGRLSPGHCAPGTRKNMPATMPLTLPFASAANSYFLSPGTLQPGGASSRLCRNVVGPPPTRDSESPEPCFRWDSSPGFLGGKD